MAVSKRKVSQMPDASPLDGSELIPVVQGGVNKKTTADSFKNRSNHTGTQGAETIEDLDVFIGEMISDSQDGLEIRGSDGVKVEGDYDNGFDVTTEFDSALDNSLATVSVGGLSATTIGNLKGKSLREIIESMVAPTVNPTLTSPSVSFTKLSPSANTLEVGSVHDIDLRATFNRGSISPQFSATSPFRSGLPNQYNYSGLGLPPSVETTGTSNDQTIIGHVVGLGNNTWSVYVGYDAGVQPYNNKGGVFNSPLAAGNTPAASVSLSGIYPFFWGKVASGGAAAGVSRPDINNSLIESGNKVVASASSTLTINFNSAADDYIWFAIPSSATSKTSWYVTALNNGAIGGGISAGGNLFPSSQLIAVDSPDLYWNGVAYKVYVSNYQTAVSVMELRN